MEEKKNITNAEGKEAGYEAVRDHGEKIDDNMMEKVSGGIYFKNNSPGKIVKNDDN